MQTESIYKIGVSMRIVEELNYSETRDAIAHDWYTFFTENFPNVIPVFLPNHELLALKTFKHLNLDGLILSGGNNISAYPQRDRTEISLLKYCLNHSIPVLGVCRGMQLICEYFQEKITAISSSQHVATKHPIQQVNPSRFLTVVPQVVNSFHNLGITDLQSNQLLEVYKSIDGTIECIEHSSLPIVGIMWHPEREIVATPSDINLINNLFLKELSI